KYTGKPAYVSTCGLKAYPRVGSSFRTDPALLVHPRKRPENVHPRSSWPYRASEGDRTRIRHKDNSLVLICHPVVLRDLFGFFFGQVFRFLSLKFRGLCVYLRLETVNRVAKIHVVGDYSALQLIEGNAEIFRHGNRGDELAEVFKTICRVPDVHTRRQHALKL